MNLRLLAFFSLALVACAEPASDEPEPNSASARIAPPRSDGGAPERPAPPASCDDQQERARALLVNHQACTADTDCALERVEAPCLAPFLCYVSVARDAGVALAREAERLSHTYRSTCSAQCPVARCASPESLRAFCDPDTRRCRSDFVPRIVDAGTPPVRSGPSDFDAGS